MSLPSPLGVFSLLLTDTSALPSGCGVDRQKADRLSLLSRAWRYFALKLRNFSHHAASFRIFPRSHALYALSTSLFHSSFTFHISLGLINRTNPAAPTLFRKPTRYNR